MFCGTDIYVVKNLHTVLLNRPATEALSVIQVNGLNISSIDTLNERVHNRFLKLFEGLVKTLWNYKITLDKDADDSILLQHCVACLFPYMTKSRLSLTKWRHRKSFQK